MYLLTLTGIYDQGTLGLFDNVEDAEAYAEELYWPSDGYHHFRIDELEVNKRIPPKRDLGKPREWINKVDLKDAMARSWEGLN